MKKTKVLIILACMTCFFYNSCEKSGYSSAGTEILDNKQIAERTIDDCDECPVDYCCCGIELAGNTTSANLALCGVYDVDTPTTPCGTSSPPSPCSSISGSRKTFMLTVLGPSRGLFCVPIGGSFSITNLGGGPVTIRFTCQAEETEADFETITIGGEDTVYFDNDGACVLTECL